MMIRQVMPAQIKALGDDEVELIISTAQLARDGHIFVPQGGRLENYRKNPVVLWQHLVEQPPVARGEDVRVEGDGIAARVRFAPTGISPKADEIRGLVKNNIISAVSIGIEPLQSEPLDPKKPRGGQRVLEWELLEISFCNVPADTGAGVTARAQRADDWKVGASRNLPLNDCVGAENTAWDGGTAASTVFDWAGGKDFSPTQARKGFLIYNAAKPKDRSSYLFPLAQLVDGRLMVSKAALRAAVTALPQTAGVPGLVRASARQVIDHYMEQAGMSKDTNGADRTLAAKHTRALERAPGTPKFKRGLVDVASFAYMLHQLGYMHDSLEYEAALEGDNSPVPGMIGEAIVKFGEGFIAMTEEEVRELLANIQDGDEEEVRSLPEQERAFIEAGKTPRAKVWRRTIALARAGRTLSASNSKQLEAAQGHHDRAMKHLRAATDHHEAVAGQLAGAQEQHGKAAKATGDAHEALTAAKAEPDEPAHVARALRAVKAASGALEELGSTHADMSDRSLDLADSHAACTRSVKSAQRCVRGVVEGATPGGEDSDSEEVQTSSGTDDSSGSSGGRSDTDFRRRQAELSALTRAAMSE